MDRICRMKVVTQKNIDQIVEENKIVFLNFWGNSCGHCKTFGPIFHNVASKNPDLFFGMVNAETEEELCIQFDVASIPTLIIIKSGIIIYDESGHIPEYALTNIVAKTRTINPENI